MHWQHRSTQHAAGKRHRPLEKQNATRIQNHNNLVNLPSSLTQDIPIAMPNVIIFYQINKKNTKRD